MAVGAVGPCGCTNTITDMEADQSDSIYSIRHMNTFGKIWAVSAVSAVSIAAPATAQPAPIATPKTSQTTESRTSDPYTRMIVVEGGKEIVLDRRDDPEYFSRRSQNLGGIKSSNITGASVTSVGPRRRQLPTHLNALQSSEAIPAVVAELYIDFGPCGDGTILGPNESCP